MYQISPSNWMFVMILFMYMLFKIMNFSMNFFMKKNNNLNMMKKIYVK